MSIPPINYKKQKIERTTSLLQSALTPWNNAATCSQTCGGGTRTKTRKCVDLEATDDMAAEVDPSHCGGQEALSQIEPCNTETCAGMNIPTD